MFYQQKKIPNLKKGLKSLFEPRLRARPETKSPRFEKMLQEIAVLKFILYIGNKGEDEKKVT